MVMWIVSHLSPESQVGREQVVLRGQLTETKRLQQVAEEMDECSRTAGERR